MRSLLMENALEHRREKKERGDAQCGDHSFHVKNKPYIQKEDL